MRTKEGQEKHDKGVAQNALAVVKAGYRVVYADLPGYSKPPLVGSYVPDVYGKKGFTEIIIEVETADTINTPHTKLQLATFRAWASKSVNRRFLVRLI